MRGREILARVGVFVVVLALVVAGAAAITGNESTDTPTMNAMTVEAYSGNDTVAAVPEETGELEVAANASGTVVVIDASHGASMDREQLTPMVEALTASGAEVRFLSEQAGRGGLGSKSPFNASLQDADAFIMFGAEQAYTTDEINGLEAFAEAGGRVLVAKEPAQLEPRFIFFRRSGPQQSISTPLTPLVSRFGVSFGNGYLYHMDEYDTNYRNVYATSTGNNALTEGVDRLVLHESTPVRGPTTVVRTISGTELSKTRTADRYGVVVQSGNMTAVGDASVFGQAYYRRADNEVFVANILEFLVTGEKQPATAPVQPEPSEEGNETRTPPPPHAGT